MLNCCNVQFHKKKIDKNKRGSHILLLNIYKKRAVHRIMEHERKSYSR